MSQLRELKKFSKEKIPKKYHAVSLSNQYEERKQTFNSNKEKFVALKFKEKPYYFVGGFLSHPNSLDGTGFLYHIDEFGEENCSRIKISDIEELLVEE